jgi:hypothetical protein
VIRIICLSAALGRFALLSGDEGRGTRDGPYVHDNSNQEGETMRSWLTLARLMVVGAVVTAGLFAVSAASASTSPPFTQCPAVGADTSCETLIVINSSGSLEASNDPSQGPFDGVEDTLVGVQNNSSTTVSSIKLSGADIFGFDGDGICSGLYTPAPPACPYGPTGYEGPKTSFEATNENEGNVNFTEGALAPGESTYFSLEENVNFVCTGTGCEATERTSLTTSLQGEGHAGSEVTVKPNSTVTDSAELSGVDAGSATGSVTYNIYSDATCKTLVTTAGTVAVSEGKVPASEATALGTSGTYYWQALYSGDSKNSSSASTCGSEIETVEGTAETPKPTTLTTTLSGGDQSGESITVSEGTAVSDGAALGGANAAKAGGTVTYKVFSDSGCTTTVAEAGTVAVSSGSVPSSNPETLAPGTYYWQASYSGDTANEASKSACGSEVETVQGSPPPEECSASGSGRFRVGKEFQTVSDKLSTEPGAKQRLKFKWNKEGKHELLLTSLSSVHCVAKPHQTDFHGEGIASVDGVGGYQVKFTIIVTKRNRLILVLTYMKGHERMHFHDAARTSEVITVG